MLNESKLPRDSKVEYQLSRVAFGVVAVAS